MENRAVGYRNRGIEKSKQFKERIKRSRVTQGITTAGFHRLR